MAHFEEYYRSLADPMAYEQFMANVQVDHNGPYQRRRTPGVFSRVALSTLSSPGGGFLWSDAHWAHSRGELTSQVCRGDVSGGWVGASSPTGPIPGQS